MTCGTKAPRRYLALFTYHDRSNPSMCPFVLGEEAVRALCWAKHDGNGWMRETFTLYELTPNGGIVPLNEPEEEKLAQNQDEDNPF